MKSEFNDWDRQQFLKSLLLKSNLVVLALVAAWYDLCLVASAGKPGKISPTTFTSALLVIQFVVNVFRNIRNT